MLNEMFLQNASKFAIPYVEEIPCSFLVFLFMFLKSVKDFIYGMEFNSIYVYTSLHKSFDLWLNFVSLKAFSSFFNAKLRFWKKKKKGILLLLHKPTSSLSSN